MKIAFLHYTSGLIDRGSEISTQTLASYLSQGGHQVFVYQLGKASGEEDYQVEQVSLLFSPKLGKSTSLIGKILARLYLDYNSLLVLAFSLKTIPSLIKNKPDLIIPTNGFWQVVISKIIKLFTRSKIIVIGRAGIGWHDRDNLRLGPDLFIGLTKKAALWAEKTNPKIKTNYLANPINRKNFLNRSKPVKIALKKPIILTVAALTAYKNIDKLIMACSKLKNTSLLVVGRGELEKKLNRMGKKYLKNRFLITSFKHSQMLAVYQKADVFALISQEQEAFGRVFLEAMACGLPVVTTDTPSRREIIGPEGIFVESLAEKSLVKALKQALEKGKTQAMKKEAEKFDIIKIGPQYEKIFLEIVGQ